MWFFIDFLPEILLFFNRIKNNMRNPYVFFATFIYLSLIITFIYCLKNRTLFMP